MKKIGLFFGLVMILVLCIGSVQADVVYSNFGPENPFQTGGIGWSIGPMTLAMPFTVSGGNFTLNSIEIAGYYATGGSAVQLSLFSNDDSLGYSAPGSEVDNLGTKDLPHLEPALVEFNATKHAPLQDGQTYWVVAAPGEGTEATWCCTQDTCGDAAAIGGSLSSWYVMSTSFPPVSAFRVNGSPVPEPTAAVAALGLLAPAGFIFRRRK